MIARPGPGFTQEQRSRWVALARLAADEASLPADPEFRAALTSYLEWSSRVALAQSGDSHPDVKAYATDILDRLVNGTMPCDSVWPPEKIDVFKRWTESGFLP